MIEELRKVVNYDEDVHREGGRAAEPPVRMIGVAAVVSNPYPGAALSMTYNPLSSASRRCSAKY